MEGISEVNSLERYHADHDYRERQKAQKRQRYADRTSAYYRYTQDHNREAYRVRLLAKYRLKEAEYTAMFVAQDGLCAICRTGAASAVDHDHETGVVRGLLCRQCNLGIGHFADNPDRLSAAAKYIASRKGGK